MIYLDHNASSPLRSEALEAMQPWLTGPAVNPASAHSAGRRARRALEDARDQIAANLGASADELVFTSGATEANNLALFGLAGDPPGRIVASPIEHPCVAEPLAQLSARGFAVDLLPVDGECLVQTGELPRLIKNDTRLVAVMLANHETGAIQPIRELVSLLPADREISFHCDAAQAVGKIPVNFHDLGVTSLSISGHKFGGPPGIGALLLNRCAKLRPLQFGGHQQRGRRPGTESVALAVGMAAALNASVRDPEATTSRMRALRRRFLDVVIRGCEPCKLNGPAVGGLPHVVNLSFPGSRGDALLMALDLAGICCSTGSACSSGSLLPSPVLKAMNVPDDCLRSAIRFSFGPTLTDQDIDEAAARIVQVVERLRRTSIDNFES
jgi:cysteine desulfurase